MMVKCNILHMDCNSDCYGIVYLCQIVKDANVNVLNKKITNLNVFLIVWCFIALMMNGYQMKLNQFANIIDYNSYNQVCR